MFCSLIRVTTSLFSPVYWEHISQSCLGDITVLCWNVNIAAVGWPDLLNVHEDKQKQHHISWVFFMDFFFLWGNKMIYSEATHRAAEFCPLLQSLKGSFSPGWRFEWLIILVQNDVLIFALRIDFKSSIMGKSVSWLLSVTTVCVSSGAQLLALSS